MVNLKFFEVGKFIAKTRHIIATLQMLVSEKTYQSLSAEHRKIVDEEAAKAWHKQRDDAKVGNEKAEQTLAQQGCQFSTVDLPAFQAAVRPLWDEWGKKTGMEKTIEAIQKL